MIDFARANAVLPVARARLFAIPGVHAVGVGRKIVRGAFTAEPAIMVFVEDKTPVAHLDPSSVIPSEIDGVKTDVYESEIPCYSAGDDPDPDDATERPLLGGIQIKPGSFDEASGNEDYQGLGNIGTLGCFIAVDGISPIVYAVTNWHVVGSHTKVGAGAASNLRWTPAPIGPSGSFTTEPANQPVTPGTEIVVEVFVADTEINAFYTTGATDTAADVAQRLADAVTYIGTKLNIGLAGSASNGTLTIQPPTGATNVRLQLAGPFSPTVGDVEASPKVVVSQTSVNPPVTTMTFSGGIDQLGGAYLSVNVGGTEPTHGIFVATQSDIASALIFAINNDLNLDGVTAEAIGLNGMTVTGAQDIKCQFTKDIRVGQPLNRFCTSRCSRCCDRRIGVVAFARLDLDLALIQLDAGLQYGGIIKDLGRITGVHDVTQDTGATVALSCRGRSSPTATHGHLVAFNVNGVITYKSGFAIDHGDGPPPWQMVTRYFTNAFAVQAVAPDMKFSRQGDSGTVIVTAPVPGSDGSPTTTVAGLLFASAGNTSLGTPIQMILDAVSGWRTPDHATIVTADSMTDFKTVPAAPGGNPFPTALARVAHRDITPIGTESARLTQVQREIGATPGGQRYGPLVMRHLDEAQSLVNTNRKMATVWHRNGGPAIADALLRMLEVPGQRIPSVINGTPLRDCLQQIASGLARYGSDALAADLKAYGPALIQMAQLTYPELLTTLGTPPMVPA